MNKNKKIVFNLIFFVLLIIVTFYILLKDQSVFEIFNLIRESNKIYIIIGIVFMFIYLLLEGINLLRTIRVCGNKQIKLASALKYSFIGFFFSAITPAASGGQPMQIYYMHRDKISVADSTLALLMNLCSYQIITISTAIVSLIFLRWIFTRWNDTIIYSWNITKLYSSCFITNRNFFKKIV